MKYVDEFRDPKLIRKWQNEIHSLATKPWTIMEVCGGQTHSIVKFGLDRLLPPTIRLIHGPGCPVCVTSMQLIDHALFIASQPNTILASFGDMLRVPGSHEDLLTIKAKGCDVRVILSPLDAVFLAQKNPEKEVVLFAVGFETTAPANAMAVSLAKSLSLKNFSLLASHVLVPPALKMILSSSDHEIQGFLAAGHVCTITGNRSYHEIAASFQLPLIVTGFEPLDIMQGIYACIEMLENKKWGVLNQYKRSVKEEGNLIAKNCVDEIFEVIDQEWRGIGMIPSSGLGLKKTYRNFDASYKFPHPKQHAPKETGCISGLVLQGKKKPSDCALFGKECHPEKPLGAPMVSTEGACSAYYQYASWGSS